MHRSLKVALVFTLVMASTSLGLDEPSLGTSRALIIVGLPGDSEHDALFQKTIRRWRDWLTGPLGFPSAEIRVLSKAAVEPGVNDGPATRESITSEVESLVQKSQPGDRAWVFVLGHGNEDEGHARLHLPGPDLRDDEFAGLFKDLKAGEQVFWLTNSGSGAFLPGLSKPGRIVVAATERSGEFNETEFPHALAEVASLPVSKIDAEQDGRVSIRELYLATTRAVAARFAADKRVPTEHAQLDDNGDRIGTELQEPSKAAPLDGVLASKTFLPK